MGLIIRPRDVPEVLRTRDLSRAAVRSALVRGTHVRVRAGALVVVDPTLPPWERQERVAMGAVAALSPKLGPSAVFSHETAALVHGLWLLDVPVTTHVTQAGNPTGTPARGLARHCAELPPHDVTVVNGLRVTTVERTILDCARYLRPAAAMAVADSGMRALVRPNRFEQERFAAPTTALRDRLLVKVGSGPGSARRRPRAVIQHATPFSESPGETRLRVILVSHGLPNPAVQLRIRTRRGVYYGDLGWVLRDGEGKTWLVVLEYDGTTKYARDWEERDRYDPRPASAFVVAEKDRENDIRELPGARLLRFTHRDLASEPAVLGRVRAALPLGYAYRLRPIPELLAVV